MIKKRRKHPRLRIPLEAEYLVAGQEEWRQGTIWTLGAGGAALLCEEELEVGTLLEGLHFVVEAEGDLPETRIDVSAKVVNIDREENIGRAANFMLGLQFEGLGEKEFELLRQFVFRRLTSQDSASRDAGKATADTGPPPLEIRYKLFDDFVEEVSENLSPSGMFIRAHRPLPPGSQFVFQFQLGEDFALFKGTAEVVWTRRRGEGPDRPAGMGVRFLNLDLTSQKLVERLVGQRAGEAEDEGEQVADDPEPAAQPEVAVKLAEEAGDPFPTEDLPAEAGSPSDVAPDPEPRLAEMRQSLAQLEKRLSEAVSARDAALEAGEEADAARAEAEARLAQLGEEAEASRAEVEARLFHLGEEAEVLRQENETLRAACEQAEEERGRTEAAAEELERQTCRAHEAEDGLERLRGELAESRREWEATESELRAQLDQRAADEAEARERLDQAVAAETELREQLAEARGSCGELEQRLALGAEVEEALRERARELRTERDRLRAGLGRMRGAAEELRSRLNGDLSSARALEADLSGRLAEVAALGVGLERKVAGLAEARAGLAERLARIDEAWSSLEGGLEEAVEKVSAEEPVEEAAEAASGAEPVEEAAEQASAVEPVEEAAEAVSAAEPVEEAAEAVSAAEQIEVASERSAATEPLEEEGEPVTGAEPFEQEAAEEREEPALAPPEDAAEEIEVAKAAVAPDTERETSPSPEPAEIAAPPADGGGFLGAARRMAARLGLARQERAETLEPAAEDERLAPVEPDQSEAPAEPEPEAGSPAKSSDQAIEETVRAWAEAWTERRVEDYLAFYSERFQPARPDGNGDEDEDAGSAPHAWLPPLAGMELTLGPISSTKLGPDRVAVRFEQSVESDTYARRTGRTLEMIREADAWKITAESFQDLSG